MGLKIGSKMTDFGVIFGCFWAILELFLSDTFILVGLKIDLSRGPPEAILDPQDPKILQFWTFWVHFGPFWEGVHFGTPALNAH